LGGNGISNLFLFWSTPWTSQAKPDWDGGANQVLLWSTPWTSQAKPDWERMEV